MLAIHLIFWFNGWIGGWWIGGIWVSFAVTAQIKLTHVNQLILRSHAIVSAHTLALGVENHLGQVLLLGFLVETLSAQWHVHLSSTDHFLRRPSASSESVVCIGGAYLANCWQFFTFSHRGISSKIFAHPFFSYVPFKADIITIFPALAAISENSTT